MGKQKSRLMITEDAALDHANVLNPVIGMRTRDFVSTGMAVIKQLVLQPAIGVKHTASLTAEIVRILAGESEIELNPKDRRFADKAFLESPVFRRLAQGWTALQNSIGLWVDDVDFSDADQERARFVAQLVVDALAPTNFLVGNPLALRRALETRGGSLARGMKNYIGDIIVNGGMPTQVDGKPFEVGSNLATTPGSVVFEHPIAELIQYGATTDKVRSRPIFFVPPQINKYYVYDLSPEKSIVKFLLDQGFQVFMISWRNPTAEERDWGLAEYVEALEEAIDAACSIARQRQLDAVGACAGGITITTALCYMAALGRQDKVASLTLMVNVLNSQDDDTVAHLFMSDDVIEAARKRSARKGVLDGKDTARVFSWMRPNDLIWNYVVNNYLLGEKPPAFDVLYWNSDTTRLPARLHSDFLNVLKDRPFANPGAMAIRDVPLDIRKVRCPVFVTGGTTDHITPWQACYRSTQLFPGDSTFVLSTAGHIQSLLNPPGSSKRRFMTNPETPEDPEEWLQNATEHDDSWWPYWVTWLKKLNATERVAPKKRGNKIFSPLRAAPGNYVHEK